MGFFWFWYIQIFKYTNIRIYEYANNQIFKYTNIRICKYSDIQIIQYSQPAKQSSQARPPALKATERWRDRALKRPSAEETGRWSLHQQALKALPPPSHLSFLSATRDTRPGRKERSEERGREARHPERLAAQKEKKATLEETTIGRDRALKRPRPQKTGRLTTCR